MKWGQAAKGRLEHKTQQLSRFSFSNLTPQKRLKAHVHKNSSITAAGTGIHLTKQHKHHSRKFLSSQFTFKLLK